MSSLSDGIPDIPKRFHGSIWVPKLNAVRLMKDQQSLRKKNVLIKRLESQTMMKTREPKRSYLHGLLGNVPHVGQRYELHQACDELGRAAVDVLTRFTWVLIHTDGTLNKFVMDQIKPEETEASHSRIASVWDPSE